MWDATEEDRKKRHEAAFSRGVLKAKQTNLLDQLLHDLGDTATVFVPETSEHKSEEAGYHAYLRGEVKDNQTGKQPSSGGEGGGGGGATGNIIGGGLILLIIAPLYVMFLLGKGVILSLEKRSVVPLLESVAGACACVGIFCTLFGILWAICLLLARDIGASAGLTSEAVAWNKLFWGIAIVAWIGYALVGWLEKKSVAKERIESSLASERSHELFDSPLRSRSSPGSNTSPKRGNLVGWIVGVDFVLIAPNIVVPVLLALFPGAQNWRLHPLLMLPMLFLFPFGPAILLGRAVARHLNAE